MFSSLFSVFPVPSDLGANVLESVMTSSFTVVDNFTENPEVETLRVCTHNGLIHADDVVALALVRLSCIPINIEVVRTRDAAIMAQADIVIDVGEGEFDHHGAAYGRYGFILGKPHCGCSILAWRLGLLEYAHLLKIFAAIAAQDNGKCLGPELEAYHVFNWVHSMNPTWEEPSDRESLDQAFTEAVCEATRILKREFKVAAAETRAACILEALPRDQAIVELPSGGLHWQSTLCPSKAVFVVYPALEGGWRLQAVPPTTAEPFEKKVPIIDPIKGEDFVFAHKDQFIAGWKSKESAIRAAKELLERK